MMYDSEDGFASYINRYDIRRYFIISYLGEAVLIFWAQYYKCDNFISKTVRSRELSVKEVTLTEAGTMEAIGDIPNLHLTDAEKWMDKKKYRNA